MNRPLSETAATALGAVADHLALGVARHRAEEARRLLASIVASSEDAILATTLDGTIVSWNGGAERLYGYAAQEALGRRISMTYPPDRIDEFYDFVGQLQTGGSVVHRETVRRRKDGVEVTVALTVSPIKDGTGALIGKSVIVRDITERKRAEQTLRESQERFRLIAETVTQVFWIADADIQAITYISPAYECIWGRSCESLYENPRSFLDAVHDDDREAVMRTLGAQQRGEPFDHEYRIIRPDGETRWIWDRGFPVAAAAGRSTQYVGVAADITESRSIEDQLRQAQKMEAIGQLAGGIAHDFNNLLTAILGFSGFLADSLPEDDDRRRDVDEIRHAGERAATLTRQLLAFGRKQILDVRVLHIGDVVGELTPMLRRLVSEAIDLRTTTGDRGVIKADPGQLQQVLMNLVVNARDAMPDGGRLTIETSDVVLDDAFVRRHPGAQPGAHVALSVRDTGIGMDAATLKRIFEPFFTTKPKGQGTGLGLATVYGIVKQSGGAIWVESEVGKGTAFTVCLPRTDEVQAADGAATTQAPARRGDETVLLVEDEDVVREFVYKVLTRKGYTVHALPDPQRAIEYAEAHRAPIDLVFTDVVLPEMNGKAMVTRLRAQHPEAKVLYMSGYDDNAIVSHGVLDIDTELLPKPFTADALMRKVRDVLDA
jgi:PAS domain S-box-containing protein